MTPISVVTIGTNELSTGWYRSFKNEQGVDLGADNMALQRLKEAAEKAKIELVARCKNHHQLAVHYGQCSAGPLHLDYKLTRAKFQEMTADLVERCKTPFEQAIKDAGLDQG